MSGVRLGELSANDMLDVVHFLVEEDMMLTLTKEKLDAKEAIRASIYENMYGTSYEYRTGSGQTSFNYSNLDDPLDEDLPPTPVDPAARGTEPMAIKPKPFVRATNVNADSTLPFGRGIDAPLG